VSGDYARPDYLIEPEELARRLEAGEVRVFDGTVFLEPASQGYRARSGREEYLAAHLPGSAFVDQLTVLSDTSSGLGFTLPESATLQSAFAELGASSDVPLVVYSTGHMMWATRLWWLLHYAGHEQVAVLNGGLDGWRSAGLPVVQEPSSYPAGRFEAEVRSERFVDQNVVRAEIGSVGVCTVNALSPEVYAGTAKMSYGRKGHIPGSVNVFYDQLLDRGRFRSAQELKAALSELGLLDAERVIAYCGGGISATIDALACLLVGQERVAVYDGSMSEWVADESLPLVVGQEPMGE
jgi:thiosulfate/3-mercaptopyruvate sulfurtransferase